MPLSDPVSATTISSGIDVTPPAATVIGGAAIASDGETWLFRHPTTDDPTPQSLIVYEVRLNGAIDHHILGDTRTILYGIPGAINTYGSLQIDESENRSGPARLCST